jgi:hypothetical protein
MGTYFEMLVDVEATVEEAEAVSLAVLGRFRELGLITGEANDECALGEQGYPPGPAVADLYKVQKGEFRFWESSLSGVAPRMGRNFNPWALGPVHHGFKCPKCAVESDLFSDTFGDIIGNAIGEWWDQSGPGLVVCPRCGKALSITEWQCLPPLGFGNLSFVFWQWPPLDSPSWALDIAGVFGGISGHTIVRTYGRI